MKIDPATLCGELPVRWTEADQAQLEQELSAYTSMLRSHLEAGAAIPSHVEGSGCLQAPITSVTDPHVLFREAAAAGEGVGLARYEVWEYPDYWMTVHAGDLPRRVPNMMLLLKRHAWPLAKLEELCVRCSEVVGARVGVPKYMAWNLPRFCWDLHTDDAYEGVCSRVHLPLRTTPQNLFVWADSIYSPWGDWLRAVHLEQGRVYQVRTDVPHTVINNHPTEGRLHLILDVEGPFRGLRAGA